MNKGGLLIFLVALLSVQAAAQPTDFPIGMAGIPTAKLKGAVHTVLTTEQRDEHVFTTTVEVYDLNGRLIESLSSNANIEVHSRSLVRLGGKTLYVYDASGKLIKERNFTPEGQYTGYEAYVYGEQNRLIETRLYSSSGKETGKRTYTYFPERREVIATWSFYHGDSHPLPPMKNILSYNEKGQWTKRSEFFGGDATSSSFVTFEYDNEGNFIKATTCCTYNFWHRYSYKFDKQGNWIERENTYGQLDNKGKEKVTPGWMNAYRVISYYSDNETKQ